MFVHIHRALSHLCMDIYTVTDTLTGRNTHAQALEEQRHPASPLAFLSYAQNQKSIFSPSDTTSLHLLSPLASLPVLSGKLFLLSIRYAPLLDILHFYPLTEKKKSFQKRALLSPCLMPGIITISTDNLGGREREAGAPQRRSTFFHPKGSPHLPYI